MEEILKEINGILPMLKHKPKELKNTEAHILILKLGVYENRRDITETEGIAAYVEQVYKFIKKENSSPS